MFAEMLSLVLFCALFSGNESSQIWFRPDSFVFNRNLTAKPAKHVGRSKLKNDFLICCYNTDSTLWIFWVCVNFWGVNERCFLMGGFFCGGGWQIFGAVRLLCMSESTFLVCVAGKCCFWLIREHITWFHVCVWFANPLRLFAFHRAYNLAFTVWKYWHECAFFTYDVHAVTWR